ncbi:hypothetical protein [Ramlibacter albus]|uniref:Uncharacterized protein n=1 Tax=Ramlibacter albus TaxID=2079448 RepID=A0A923S803_9BURK|nr:hypothetical protein [Ramlibacter albus]MBC5767617.1 hypothetical protein [Ramlibacter albus]
MIDSDRKPVFGPGANDNNMMALSSKLEGMQRLQRRFAMRLAVALDAITYPVQRTERARQLSVNMSISIPTDIETATQLLGGHCMPSYEQLMALCDITRRPPGYFLDEHRAEALPPDTVVVKPIGPGESIAIRFPSEAHVPASELAGLMYHVAKVPMGFGIAAGDYLVVSAPVQSTDVTLGRLYLFEGDAGFDLLECTECTDRHAVFRHDEERDVPHVVFHGRAGNQNIRALFLRLQFAQTLAREIGRNRSA